MGHRYVTATALAVCALLGCLVAGPARAQLTVHGEAGVGTYLSRPGSIDYWPGGVLAVRADHPMWRSLAAESSVSLLLFPPASSGTTDLGTILAFGVGVRLRPLETIEGLSPGARSAWAAGTVHGVGAGQFFRLGYELGAG